MSGGEVEKTESAGDAGMSGTAFCDWCLHHWPVYESLGGPCSLLSIKPSALSGAGVAEVEAAFPRSLCNPLGGVHGGASSMLLDEVGGLAVCCALGFRYLRGTTRIEVTFLKRAAPGPVTARASVSRQDELHMRAEAEIVQGGEVIARAHGLYRVHAPGTAPRPARPGEV